MTELLKTKLIVFVPFATCFLFSLPLGVTFLTSCKLSHAVESRVLAWMPIVGPV
jgi:hypothetical protein